jgi:2-C-methyl-D-erythritol 4-phosphate cytidylyltransferase
LFANHPEISEIVVVCDPAYHHLFAAYPHIRFAQPGSRRQDSVFNGLQLVSPDTSLVCIHDSARPLLSPLDLDRVIKEGKIYHAATLASPVKYTLKQRDENGFVTQTIDRSQVWEIHTPQIATLSLLLEGLSIAERYNLSVTDDMGLVELTGHAVKLVPGSSNNIKITTLDDWHLAEALISCQSTK